MLRHAGPLGAPGMPEWGQLPIPKKLLAQGVRDMLRISDARMSGTSYGACVLHVAPESFVGGPLAFVRDGDVIELDVPARRLHLHVDDAELARRRAEWSRRRRTTRAASARSTSSTSSRPTKAATSTSSAAPRRCPNRKSTDVEDRIPRREPQLANLVAAIMEGGGCAPDEARAVGAAPRRFQPRRPRFPRRAARRQVPRVGARRDAHAQHAADDRVRERFAGDRRRPPRLRPGDRRVRHAAGHRQGGEDGHRDGGAAQLRAPRPAGRLGGDGRRRGPGVAALPQHLGRAARRAVRRQRPPAVDQPDGDRRAARRRPAGRSSTSRPRPSPRAS